MKFIGTILVLSVTFCQAASTNKECPSTNDKCRFKGEFDIPFTRKGAPECWGRYKDTWICDNKSTENSCVGSGVGPDYIDVSTCPGYNPKNTCPSKYDKCDSKDEDNIPFTRMGAPQCWAWSEGRWICDKLPADEKCTSSDTGSIGFDVSSCPGYVHKLLK